MKLIPNISLGPQSLCTLDQKTVLLIYSLSTTNPLDLLILLLFVVFSHSGEQEPPRYTYDSNYVAAMALLKASLKLLNVLKLFQNYPWLW